MGTLTYRAVFKLEHAQLGTCAACGYEGLALLDLGAALVRSLPLVFIEGERPEPLHIEIGLARFGQAKVHKIAYSGLAIAGQEITYVVDFLGSKLFLIMA